MHMAWNDRCRPVLGQLFNTMITLLVRTKPFATDPHEPTFILLVHGVFLHGFHMHSQSLTHGPAPTCFPQTQHLRAVSKALQACPAVHLLEPHPWARVGLINWFDAVIASGNHTDILQRSYVADENTKRSHSKTISYFNFSIVSYTIYVDIY